MLETAPMEMLQGTRSDFSGCSPHPLWLERNKRNLTQQMLADFTQLSLSTVERAERGECLRAYSRQQLCAFFGKTALELGLAFAHCPKGKQAG